MQQWKMSMYFLIDLFANLIMATIHGLFSLKQKKSVNHILTINA